MESTCETELIHGDGLCTNSTTDETGEQKYPDGKCGIHSKHSERNHGREIQEPLIREFLDKERQDRPAHTYDNRLTGLRAYDEWLESTGRDLLDVGPLSFEDYVRWVRSERDLSDGTVGSHKDQVSKLYEYLERKEKEEYGRNGTVSNPTYEARLNLQQGDSRMSKELADDEGYVAISADEWGRFKECISSPTIRNGLIFQLMWDCGLRPVEVTEIRYERDIDRELREINIRSDKTHLNRTVFYGDEVETLLRLYLDGGERERYNTSERSPYLIVTNKAEKIKTKAINDAFRAAAKDAELQVPDSDGRYGPVYYANGKPQYRIRPYSLRHGFAEKMVAKGVDIKTLKTVMGHRNIETTMQYVNPDKETRRNNIQSALDD